MGYIRAEDREQIILFPERVDEYVDENNAVRVIEAYINSLDLEALGFVRSKAKGTGRPPYDPKDILKLYVYGYMNRIRSSRRLEKESKINIELIWLMRRLSPDHKTIATFRKDNSDGLKSVFRNFVKLCIRLDLYGRELAAIDGSKFKAYNAKERNFTKDKLEDRLKRINEKIDEYVALLEERDRAEETEEEEMSVAKIKQIIKEVSERKERYEGYKGELESSGESQKSLTDSDSRLMNANGKMDVCYNVQTAVDAKNKLVVEFDVTNKANDMNQITPMAEKVQGILETTTLAVTADAGYASACDIAAAIMLGVQPHIAGTDYDICIAASKGDKTEITSHNKGKCVYVKERNVVLCPMGKVLYPGYYKKSKGVAVFHNSEVCKACSCRCTTESRGFRYEFKMAHCDFSKEYDEKGLFVRQIHVKPKKEIYKLRKSLAEHPFGTIKRTMDAGYCLMKGLQKVSGEFSLVFIAYNLKRVINILGTKKLLDVFS